MDASVAVAFALAVTWPEAGNIGGGGFMLVYPGGNRKAVVIDYREVAPLAATRHMFSDGRPPSAYLLVGTPVRGLECAHREFGKLPWKDLLQPAIKLAEGFTIDRPLADSLNFGLAQYPNLEFQRVYGKPGKAPWKPGDRLIQKELAGTLRTIAEKGADAFYRGAIAKLIVEEMKAGGGLLGNDDLAAYRAKIREPIHGSFRGHDVYAPPLPSSGGICLVQMLNVLEGFDLHREGRWSRRTLHLMIETMRLAYADRTRLGDSDFVPIPQHLTSKEYAGKLARTINLEKATLSEDVVPHVDLSREGSQTTHFSVIDKDRMAVSNTYTLEEQFGSRIVVRGGGFLLNNEMGDFNPRPGITTRSGLIGTPANEIAPGKRMLSSMTPTVVAKNGRAVLITGSPGGRTIINTVLQIILNVLEFDMPLRDAVAAPRFHHGWFPDVVWAEGDLVRNNPDVVNLLRASGHRINPAPVRQGDAHSIRVSDQGSRYEGVADHRWGGWACGY